jgi:hypothetical protein
MEMKLKDGTPLLQKQFESVRFDKGPKTFFGTLNFGKNPWLAYYSMDFTLVFSDDFDSIIGGKRECKNKDGKIIYVSKYGPSTFSSYVLFKERQ